MKKSKIILIMVILFVLIILGVFITLKIYKNTQIANTNGIKYEGIANVKIDTSEKIGKLYNHPNKIYTERKYIKEISQIESDDINRIITESEKILSILDFVYPADYILEYNDSAIHSIEFRPLDNSIVAVIDTISCYKIYKEDDVKRLKNILGLVDIKNVVYSEIDIKKISVPPTLYINSTKIYQSTYSWTKYINNDLVSITNVDNTSPQDMLKNAEAISTFCVPVVSANADLSSNTLTRLPSSAKMQYTIYKNNEIFMNSKEAEVMIDGSFHLGMPTILGEYIYVLDLSFKDNLSNHASYCFKYKV